MVYEAIVTCYIDFLLCREEISTSELNVMLHVELSSIKAIEAEVQSGEGYISLSQGALRVGGIPQEIKNHLQEVLYTDKTDYYQSAWGILPLRDKIAETLSAKNNISLSWKNIIVTHGCIGAISTLLLLLLDEGDEVILPEPTYPAYKHVIPVARGKAVFVPCDSETWDLNFAKIKSAKTNKTKIVMFSNPCNPTGKLYSKEVITELVMWCEANGIYLVVDECYDEYVFDDKTIFSATQFVPTSKFIIRTGSYSKSLSMSGWRIGFMVVPEHLSIQIGTVQDALLNCPNVIAQHAVLYALDHPRFIKNFRDIVEKNRDLAEEMLHPLVDREIISFQRPQAGLYIFVKTNELDSYDLCFDILRKAKVGLIPGRAFGLSGVAHLRLCFARTPEVLSEGITRLTDYFLKGNHV